MAERELLRPNLLQTQSAFRQNAYIRHFEQRIRPALETKRFDIITYTPVHLPGEKYTPITMPVERIIRVHERIALSFTLDGLDNGLNNEDYERIIRGELGEAPKHEDPSICPDGHAMLNKGEQRSQHYFCPPCNYFRWGKDL